MKKKLFQKTDHIIRERTSFNIFMLDKADVGNKRICSH